MSVAAATTGSGTKTALKQVIRTCVPLFVRKRAAVLVQRLNWIDQDRRHWWSVELVRDLADRDVDSFHEFLWTNHLGYAVSYEAAGRFGVENMKLSRRMFFSDLREVLDGLRIAADRDVRSVFEVGCSLGYQLRFIETDLCPRAEIVEGVDIDRYAIESGSEYLRAAGSRVALKSADMRDLETVLGTKTYDLIICTGVLMYLTEQAAAEVVGVMLRRARLVAMAGLAHPAVDNSRLAASETRASDSTFVHNIDAMVRAHGGSILARRWEGGRDVDGNTIYFVFATRGAGQ